MPAPRIASTRLGIIASGSVTFDTATFGGVRIVQYSVTGIKFKDSAIDIHCVAIAHRSSKHFHTGPVASGKAVRR